MHCNGIVQWLDIDPNGLSASIGHPAWDRTQLATFRAKASQPKIATNLGSILSKVEEHGWTIDVPELKRPLRDLPEEHPNPDLARHKHLSVTLSFGKPRWAFSQNALAELVERWRPAEPLVSWLSLEIGCASEPQF